MVSGGRRRKSSLRSRAFSLMFVTLLVLGEAAFSSASIVFSGVDAMLLIAGVWITVPESTNYSEYHSI